MNSNDSQRIFSNVKEIAMLLGVKESWVYQKTRLKAIPYIKIGKYLRFDCKEVLEFFRANNQ